MPEIPKATAIVRYRSGQPMASLARKYGVSAGWLTQRFREWGEPIRGHAEAQRARRGMTLAAWRALNERRESDANSPARD
ncbi:hypothetical protein [Streptomyces sp. B6B3]|uniref:hypothetical protein n=1 Tax=Streptomyces sp. B6B3 TaxID=3153570 RepID=UPI00325F2EAC